MRLQADDEKECTPHILCNACREYIQAIVTEKGQTKKDDLNSQEGWIFDIELLTLATLAGIPITEVPITWKEVEGSKMQLLKDSIAMAIDLLVIRANYSLGRWQKPIDIASQ